MLIYDCGWSYYDVIHSFRIGLTDNTHGATLSWPHRQDDHKY
jgi:hypothetical protein